MTEGKTIRLSQISRRLNVGTATIVAFLAEKGFKIDNKPSAKVTLDQFEHLSQAFAGAATDKEEASSVAIGASYMDHTAHASAAEEQLTPTTDRADAHEEVGNAVTMPRSSSPLTQPKAGEVEAVTKSRESLKGLTVLGSIDLSNTEEKRFRQVASSDTKNPPKRKLRKRIETHPTVTRPSDGKAGAKKEGISEREIQEQIKSTLAKLSGNNMQEGRAKHRREKRSAAEAHEEELQRAQEEAKVLKIAPFSSANDLASLMGVSVSDVLSTCMTLGMATSINQRLDAETITIIADELGYQVDFISAPEEVWEEEQDPPETMVSRAPIVTVMGHVDHGKTSLLDYIRKSQIAQGESGGITQHIGAYDVVTERGKRITFLDTPGHEAFTAMRARGASVTDVVIVVVAADDGVMPQTKEAINHAQIAGVPIVVAITKIDKPGANVDKIREALSGINILVEEWGGKYQSQAISAKTGQGVPALLEKVLLEAELLALAANPDKHARGTVLEASLDQGRGYVSTLMVQSGTLKIGDVVLAGAYYGKVRAMTNHLHRSVKEAIPSTPVQVLGLNGAPQAGDAFRVMSSDKAAREGAVRKQQMLREQSLRTKTHLTLDEIGRRLSVGHFKELNIVLKGDVDGSVEALADALLKLSTEEIQVNVIYKNVGAISESDVLLASSTNAMIIGFQVRPAANVRKMAEREGIEIRLHTIIYDAIDHIKHAMQGMLAPSVEEVVTGNATVREVFRIAKVGTVAGCYVTDGFIKRAHSIRLIRDGIVVYTGKIHQIKRLKEDVQEVKQGFECGISIQNFNDIKVGDVLEGFEQKEVTRTL